MTNVQENRPVPRKIRPVYVPAVGPRLRILLIVVLSLVAILGANSAYLACLTFLGWLHDESYQNSFYLWMFLVHVVLGLLLIVPVIVFGLMHMLNTRKRKNRIALRVGYALFTVAVLLLATGLLLVRVVGTFDLKNPAARTTVYWLHVLSPLAVVWLYCLHRLAGPRIRWRIGAGYLGVVGVLVAGIVVLHQLDPREWNVTGPKKGEPYFNPSLARTVSGNFIPARALMMDSYCLKCHQDVHAGWKDSAHHFSSFNNPAYLATVRETRKVALKRDGNVQASRWCAGCHDPVPFFSGAFDDPQFDDVNHATAQAGITCTSCHAITHINSARGNGDYTIEEPLHYPFAYSKNRFLQWVNNQLVKAKPAFHKKTFLKPFHKTAKFCSVCHKVNLPTVLTKYDGFLRGQNHYDSFLLSGVSGGGARSFYYPKKAESNCNGCHMPLKPSDDFAARKFANAKTRSIHNHLFPAANTGIAWLKNRPQAIRAHRQILAGCLRVDIFGLKEGGQVAAPLTAPLRPRVPKLRPGRDYLLETVIRTLTLGHHFTQGTVDSNEIWLDVTVSSGGKVIGQSGGLDAKREVDPRAHFVNVFMLDQKGKRIDRRNAQDIFVPLYNHQIPPGAGQTVHYAFSVPKTITAPLSVSVKVQYRKFDWKYMDFIARTAKPGDQPLRGHLPGKKFVNNLPIVTLAEDRITFPIRGIDVPVTNRTPKIPLWQRWNDYGIGLLLKKRAGQSVEPTQAAMAFREVEKLGRFDGLLNRVRVLLDQKGRRQLAEAVVAINKAATYTNPAPPPWTLAWLRGTVLRRQGRFAEAVQNFRSVLEDKSGEIRRRGFDFSRDYIVINLLGKTLREQANVESRKGRKNLAEKLNRDAADQFQKTLKLDVENETAHKNLHELYRILGEVKKAAVHLTLLKKYDQDESRGSKAQSLARQEKGSPAVQAAEQPAVYWLNHADLPQLPAASARPVSGNPPLPSQEKKNRPPMKAVQRGEKKTE